MVEQPDALDSPLLAALSAFYVSVVAEPRQPLNQLAEEAVQHWTRVVDGQDLVQPRLNERGYAPTAFHFAVELSAANRLDACEVQAGPEGFVAALEHRLQALRADLERYFGQPGYRSSSERCDRALLELARLSRFLNTWAAEGEAAHRRRWRGRPQAEHDTVNLYAPLPEDDRLGLVRWHLALWEPLLNVAIVAWEENQLDWFDRALRALLDVLRTEPAARAAAFPALGYPLRRRGLPRQRVMVLEPEQRPLRSRSVLWVRYNQLLDKIAVAPPELAGLLEELAGDVAHFTRMVERNLFLLAATPGFYERGRAGVPVIRNRTTTHPFLLDPIGFFKRAMLFHNGTYTVAGGGLDVMYLQLRQLERLCKFERWGDWARPLRTPLLQALTGWEENRWDACTEGLLQVADQFRKRAEAEAPEAP
jgi:hypothetical protein